MAPTETLAQWIIRQQGQAADAMFGAISATHLIKQRPGFGQSVIPAPGSVLASPADASWDPEPDYFFHWLRDGALAMDAVRLLRGSQRHGRLAAWELQQYVGFSSRLAGLDGPARLKEAALELGVEAAYLQYVRDPEDLRAVHGDAARGDVRFNPDCTLDITRWSRPQYDGVALRALGLLRASGPDQPPEWGELIAGDLDCVARNATRPCVDLWEEEEGFHAHTLLAQYAALAMGAVWAARHEARAGRARLWREAADAVMLLLGQLRRDDEGWIVSRMAGPDGPPVSAGKMLDGSVILGVIHAALAAGPFSVADPLVQGTLLRLEGYYAAAMPLNVSRAADCAPHLGRNPDDSYFDGGTWPLITLAAAELRFGLARAVVEGRATPGDVNPRMWSGETWAAGSSPTFPVPMPLGTPADETIEVARGLIAAGEAGFAAVRAITPADGSMAEQADRVTGAQCSARDLTWSYAAFISAAAARQQALDCMGATAI